MITEAQASFLAQMFWSEFTSTRYVSTALRGKRCNIEISESCSGGWHDMHIIGSGKDWATALRNALSVRPVSLIDQASAKGGQ